MIEEVPPPAEEAVRKLPAGEGQDSGDDRRPRNPAGREGHDFKDKAVIHCIRYGSRPTASCSTDNAILQRIALCAPAGAPINCHVLVHE